MDKNTQIKILSFIKYKLAEGEDPRLLGKSLIGPLSGFWRYRVGKYRIICQIEYDNSVIMVVLIGKRDSVYTSDVFDNKTLH